MNDSLPTRLERCAAGIVRSILIAGMLLFSGCSALIATSGLELGPYVSRDEVRQRFGPPAVTGQEGENDYDDFHTRLKISEVNTNGMAFAMTFGLSEFILFPTELYRLGRNTIVGRTVRFTYDVNGHVLAVHIDGESAWWVKFERKPDSYRLKAPPSVDDAALEVNPEDETSRESESSAAAASS